MRRPYPRWAISFADLVMLLLAFFVMLQATNHETMAAGARVAFGDRRSSYLLFDKPAASLFEPGEARLTASGEAQLRSIARSAQGRSLLVESHGQDRAGARFDGWELSAARTAAIARALSERLGKDQVEIVMGGSRDRRGSQNLTVSVAQ